MPAYTGFQPNTVYPTTTWSPPPVPNTYLPPSSTQQSGTGSNLMTIFVNSTDEVTNYPVAAGLTVMLIGFNLGKFWLKSTSTNGVPQPIREFTFTEEISAPNNQNDGVTREEFKALNEKLDKLIQDLGGAK